MARQRRSDSIVVIYSPPDGAQRHNVTAPSGRDYHVPYREPFEIEAEDAEWFFTGWAGYQWTSRYEPPVPVDFSAADRRVEYCPTCSRRLGDEPEPTPTPKTAPAEKEPVDKAPATGREDKE